MDELQKYRELMKKPISKSEIVKMLGGAVKVIPYKEIETYETIEQLMEPYNQVCILYPNPSSDPNEPVEIGHWAACYLVNKEFQYFDSLGGYIDESISTMNKKDALAKEYPISKSLIELLLKSDIDNIYWNEYKMQATTTKELEVNTCGLWVILRLLTKMDCDENDFYKTYYEVPASQGILPDLAVAACLGKMYPELLT